MADPKGFLKVTERELPARRPVPVRIMDWKEVYEPGDQAVLRRQASRCMDCGIPFCHKGCPLGNLIPEWNDLTRRGEGREASERLHATNNFPEFTGRLCPAPCESSCVLGINQPAVTIKQIEVSIADEAFAKGWIEPEPPARMTGKTVAIVGSGPAGLAAAQQLTRAGHTVAVFERDDRIGGLLRYGIPDFKMEKEHIAARLRQMRAEGTRFREGVHIGVDITWAELRSRYDAVVIGGGDTGADCIGTAHRQGARSVTNLAIGTQPPQSRTDAQPWPTMPNLFEVQSAHEEGGERVYLASTVEFLADEAGRVRALRVAETEYVDGRRVPKSGTEREIPADLVLIAMGFTGPERQGLEEQLGVRFTSRGTLERDAHYAASESGMFVAGDAGRGQSLIVWAIAEGRAAAARVDAFLMGSSELPAPVAPGDVAIGLHPA